ncbi:MAG: FHA domain-containing protein [Elusimicrobia bacterium]|nr:FHA domain-containing protein [Elusimicrobiota bacterium]
MRKIIIAVTEGSNQGETYYVNENEAILVGRDSLANIKLELDTRVSRKHAIIALKEESYILDLSSTNGTFLNNSRITGRAAIKDGDYVTVGKTKLKINIKTFEEKK